MDPDRTAAALTAVEDPDRMREPLEEFSIKRLHLSEMLNEYEHQI